jgi:hypothetical protein
MFTKAAQPARSKTTIGCLSERSYTASLVVEREE